MNNNLRMSNLCDNDVIDLTDSFTLVDHNNLHNTIIDLAADPDDTIIDTTESLIQSNSRSTPSTQNCNTRPCELLNHARQRGSLIPIKKNNKKQTGINNKKTNSSKFGECPICWDDLDKNPLASTKCGHVYCFKCIEKALQIEKKCPCCRCVLKGNSAYHPLYLPQH